MSRGRPTVSEERWLAVAARLRGIVDSSVLAERAGGWRITGPLARVALFVLGAVAAALLALLLGIDGADTLAGSGVVAIAAAEFLIRSQRMYASGVEEGLWTAGAAMLAGWLYWQAIPHDVAVDGSRLELAIGLALLCSGLRLGNGFVTTTGVLVAIDWANRTWTSQPSGVAQHASWIGLALATIVAAGALAAGARRQARPSLDRTLDWLAACLVPAAWVWSGGSPFGPLDRPTHASIAVSIVLLAYGVAAITAGVRRRRHAPVAGGLVAIACAAAEVVSMSALTIEARLILGGAAMLGIGLALDRGLRAPRHGITSAPLGDDDAPGLLQAAGTAILTAQAAPTTGAPGGAESHAGRFGGGGASGNF